MTLLDEYQALPGEPDHAEYAAHWRASLGGDFPDVVAADITRDKLERREAVIRLLCRALREMLNDMSEPTFSDPRISYIEVQVTPAQLDEARALLTAVERDFKEGA